MPTKKQGNNILEENNMEQEIRTTEQARKQKQYESPNNREQTHEQEKLNNQEQEYNNSDEEDRNSTDTDIAVQIARYQTRQENKGAIIKRVRKNVQATEPKRQRNKNQSKDTSTDSDSEDMNTRVRIEGHRTREAAKIRRQEQEQKKIMRKDQTQILGDQKQQTLTESIDTDSLIQIDEHATSIAAATRTKNNVKQPYIWGNEDNDTHEDEEIADYRFRQEWIKTMAPKDHRNIEQTTTRIGYQTSQTIPSSNTV
jgi:hypothetical protein